MINIATTKLYKNNQTAVPSEIRKEFGLKPDVLIYWNKNEKGEIFVEFKENNLSFDDLVGIGSSPDKTNSVNLKRGLYK